jgi:hypothetical protein
MGDVFYSEDYWKDTADKLASWGVVTLQQDYMSSYEGDPVMMSDLDKMNTYFKNQARALRKKGITMQYCMTLPRNIMESTENPIVLSLQVTGDHHVYMAEPEPQHRDDDPYEWKQLLFGSAVYGSVGLWPSRDNIQTKADPNAFEDTLIANLLGGEIQLGHRIGECDFGLVRKTYREGDGLVLKADRPIVPLDRCYHEGCAAGYTESDKNGKRWFYVLNLPAAGSLSALSLDNLGVQGQWLVYDYDTGSVSLKDATTPIALRHDGKHEYMIVAPVLENGMTVIGDTDKFITMADMRISAVEADRSSVRVGVISNKEKNPIVTGYSEQRPAEVKAENVDLKELSSLARLQSAVSGWYWDNQTHLWYVKVDFSGSSTMDTRSFTVSSGRQEP